MYRYEESNERRVIKLKNKKIELNSKFIHLFANQFYTFYSRPRARFSHHVSLPMVNNDNDDNSERRTNSQKYLFIA